MVIDKNESLLEEIIVRVRSRCLILPGIVKRSEKNQMTRSD